MPVVIRRQTGIYVGEQLLIKVKCEINSEYRTEWETEKSEKLMKVDQILK